MFPLQGQDDTMVKLDSITIGSDWVVNENRLKVMAPTVDMQLLRMIRVVFLF